MLSLIHIYRIVDKYRQGDLLTTAEIRDYIQEIADWTTKMTCYRERAIKKIQMEESQKRLREYDYANGVNKRCKKVVISDRAYASIVAESLSRDPLETGGILLGHYENGIWYVVESTDPVSYTHLKAKDTLIWKYASEDEIISASLSGSVYAPNDTMNSILSVFDQKMRTFTIQPTLLNMLASNNIDIDSVGKQRTAIFLITPDEKTTYHRLVSLFIKQSYESIIYSASLNKGNRVNNRINYILDEFSSLPAINDMPAMISAARSRMIRFLLIVQSKHQLEKRYKEEAATIISNCNNWIFLTSRELDLLRELSELCGEKANRTPNLSLIHI